MQTEERKQFHLNPQVLIMLAAIFVALALPLAAVIGFAVGNFKTRETREVSPEATAALERSLEEAAQNNLPVADLSTGMAVEISAENVSAKKGQIIKLAEDMGGSAMDMGENRLWAQLPESRLESFKKACRSGENAVPFQKVPDAPMVLLEVVINPKKP